MTKNPKDPLSFFWQCLRIEQRLWRAKGLSEALAPEYNAHACDRCGEMRRDEGIAVAPCLNCGRWICHQCHNPDLPFGSVSDFNYFLVDAGRIPELEGDGVRLWPILCPYCRTEVPRPDLVLDHLLPEEFRRH